MATATGNNRVLTNNVGLAYTIEEQLGVPGTGGWFNLEPNGINTFGATITTVARSPISPNRQRRKGTVTDLDSAVEMEADLTASSFRDFIEGFVFVVGINTDLTQLISTGVATDTYQLQSDITAAQGGRLVVSSLLWASGFSNAANNGLKEVDIQVDANDEVISVADTLADEASADGRVSIAGYRVPDATAFTWTYDGVAKQATLGSTGLGTLLETMGLFPGMLVHFGSVATVGGAIQNAFDDASTDDAFGYGRVVSVSADAVVFDKLSTPLQNDALSDTGVLDIVFGEFMRNVSVSDAAFLERCFSFEASFPGLGDGTPGNTDDAYQYARGNFCNTVAFDLPLTNKATVTFAFVGTDTENPTTTRDPSTSVTAATGVLTAADQPGDGDTVTIGGTTYTFQAALVDAPNNVLIGATTNDSLDNLVAAIGAGAGAGTLYGTGTVANPDATAVTGVGTTVNLTSTATGASANDVETSTVSANLTFASPTLTGASNGLLEPTQTSAFNTSSDIARLRVTEADEDGLTTDFKSLNLTLNNNVSPEKVVGTLGAAFINTGNFEVDIEAQLLFSNPLVVNKIRDNETVTMDFILKNDDGVIGIDIPAFTLGGGDREFPVNESVLINTTSTAFIDPVLRTSIGVSIFPVPLP